MILAFCIILLALACFELGRDFEARRCNADLRKLGRHIDRQINEHREAVRNLP